MPGVSAVGFIIPATIPPVLLKQRVSPEWVRIHLLARPSKQLAEECTALLLIRSDKLMPDEGMIVFHSAVGIVDHRVANVRVRDD